MSSEITLLIKWRKYAKGASLNYAILTMQSLKFEIIHNEFLSKPNKHQLTTRGKTG